MKSKRKTPDIRFRGFTDDWEQRKLSDVMSDFIVPMRDKPKEFSGNTPWTRIEDIEGKYLNGSLSEQYVSSETIKKMNLKIIPRGSLIVSASATFGVVAIVTQDLITNQTFIGLVPERDFDLDFLYVFFQSPAVQRKMKLESAGSTIFYISRQTFENMKFLYPNYSEQKKIGSFFANLDKLITLNQRKLQQLKEVKRGMLLKMFPIGNKKTPSLRFYGFKEKWVNKRIRDLILKGGSGGTPRSTNPEFYNGDIPFLSIKDITSSNGYIVDTEKKITKEGLENSSAWIVPSGSICLAMYASVGKLAIANIDLATSQAFYNMVFESDIIRNFSYQRLILANESGEWERLVSTGTQANLNAEKVRNFEFKISKEEEELKEIGLFFKKLDRMIELQEREIELLEETKKGFLQKMFV